jgi:hypothetical protein
MPALPANFLNILKSKLETDFVPLLPELLNKERPKADQDKKQLSRAFSGFVLHKMLNLGIADAAQSVVDDFDDTGKLVGEGFDHPPLDTLVLAMPVSWKGTLQQYAGRLHREHATKADVRIIDFVDTGHPALLRMWDKRQRGYRAMGYRMGSDSNTDGDVSPANRGTPEPAQAIKR